VDEAALRAVSVPGLEVREVTRHGNKLKPGHLAGNRFRIRVRGAGPGDEATARQALAVLTRHGLPNAYGVQRFGRDGTTALIGRALLRDDHFGVLRLLLGEPRPADPPALAEARARMAAGDLAAAAAAAPSGDDLVRRALRAAAQRGSAAAGVRALPKRFLNLLVSAVQSELFNRVLAARAASFDRVLEGDVAWLHARGACFVVTDAAAEAGRAETFEISPSGPMFGTRTLMGAGEPRRIEEDVLAEAGLAPEDFGRVPGLRQKGARRPLRVPLVGASAAADAEGLVLGFDLPAGSYATVVLEQVLRGGGEDAGGGDASVEEDPAGDEPG
jgi:tRNA pseudouridine13 synthase